MIAYPERTDVFNWSIANLGRREMYVTHLVGSPVKILRPQWLFKPMNRHRARKNETRFLLPFDHMHGRLPQKVSALNNTILVYDQKKLGLPDIQELLPLRQTEGNGSWAEQRSIEY
jgi:hypothetical protein